MNLSSLDEKKEATLFIAPGIRKKKEEKESSFSSILKDILHTFII